MTKAAETRASLLIRLRDAQDEDAWSQFADIYGPMIFGFGRRCGMQETDAADLVQEVMSEVSKSIARFQYDPQTGRFRSWLYRIAKRTAGRLRQKHAKQPTGTGDSAMLHALHQLADAHTDLEDDWNRQYERQLLDWASLRIRDQFKTSTWQAFWRTAVEGLPPQAVAEDLGISVGSVYVAKTRVIKRLIEKIREIDDDQ